MVKLSVIVPIYNAEKHLRECLDSLKNQLMKDIEFWLIDDGSKDSSIDICNEYKNDDARFHVYSQSNKGAGAARDIGVQLSRGEFIGFLDADDWIDSDMFEKMYNAAIEFHVDVVRCNTMLHKCGKTEVRWNPPFCNERLDPNRISEEVIPLLIAPQKEANYNDRLLRGCVCNIFRKEIINQNNIHFTDLKSGEDVLFTIEALLAANGMVILPDAFYHYMFYNADSLSKSSSSINLSQRAELRERMRQLLKDSSGYEEVKKRWLQEDRRLVYLDVRIISVYSANKTTAERLHELKTLLRSKECEQAFREKISTQLPIQMYILYRLIRGKHAWLLYHLVRFKFRGELA